MEYEDMLKLWWQVNYNELWKVLLQKLSQDLFQEMEVNVGEKVQMKKGEGVKYDQHKPRWSLLPWKQIEWVVKVLTVGAIKYSDDNWKFIPNIDERYSSACMRHLVARMEGNVHDEETGLPHLAHAVCCILFWMWFDDNPEERVIE